MPTAKPAACCFENCPFSWKTTAGHFHSMATVVRVIHHCNNSKSKPSEDEEGMGCKYTGHFFILEVLNSSSKPLLSRIITEFSCTFLVGD